MAHMIQELPRSHRQKTYQAIGTVQVWHDMGMSDDQIVQWLERAMRRLVNSETKDD